MKNIKSRKLEATPMGGETSKEASYEKLTFRLFQNYVKSDLMSNNMKMSDEICNQKSDT